MRPKDTVSWSDCALFLGKFSAKPTGNVSKKILVITKMLSPFLLNWQKNDKQKQFYVINMSFVA